MSRSAAFLDRDGTIMRDVAYVRDPNDVELLPGTAEAIRLLNDRDIPVIVVTNQSGIARGLVTPAEYEAVRARLDRLLGEHGARITASYMCPHHPDAGSPCDCRKPGVKMYRDAIATYDLDPARSLFTGDRWRDVAPAATLGGLGVLLIGESTPPEDADRARAEGIATVASLGAAIAHFVETLPA